jgi:ribonuclease HI
VPRSGGPARRSVTSTQDLTVAEVLERFHDGPTDGIFTDGSSRPNPGPGGWGAVLVRNNEMVDQRHGADPHTTNNRMELTALIAGLEMAPAGTPIVVYSDSLLVVNTLTKWAKGWEARGWKRKEGEIANLDLVKRAWELVQERPNVRIQWIRAHDGSRWNEYADALSTAHLRTEA